MRRFAAVVMAVLMLVGCQVEWNSEVPEEFRSRILDGEGKLAQFDLFPEAEADIHVSSTDVHAQRRAGDLTLHFDSLVFELKPGVQETASLDSLIATAYRRTASGSLEKVASSDEHDLNDVELSPSRRRHVVRRVELRVDDRAQECDAGCVVKMELMSMRQTGSLRVMAGLVQARVSSGRTIESSPVMVELSAGKAGPVEAVTKPAAAPAAVAPPPRETRFEMEDRLLGGCAWLTEEEASAAMGQRMRYRDIVGNSLHCTLEPVAGGDILWFSFVHDVPRFDDVIASVTEVEMFILGDRAAWLPQVATLWVENGRTTFDVRIGEINAPPANLARARQQAEAVARVLVSKKREFRPSVSYTIQLQ